MLIILIFVIKILRVIKMGVFPYTLNFPENLI